MDVRKTSRHLQRVRAPALYFAALTLPTGPTTLLEAISEVVLSGGRFQSSQERWGELTHRRRETVNRWVAILRERGLVRVVRRGKRLTNFYLLSRALWCRLTGRGLDNKPSWLRDLESRVQLRFELGAGDTRPVPITSSA